MRVVHSPHEAYALVDFERRNGNRVGLVPTMGALHAGHVSLVEHARLHSDIVAATIFVNPTQFGPKEDFGKYPRTLESDLEKLDTVGCDIVFVPSPEQVYAPEHSTYVEPPKVANRWEGEIRPGHFRGVCTVVLKLFMMVPAQVAFFGRKDYQQVAVIRAMVEDLNLPIQIVTCDTIRESDGLAMSSRNRYLNDSERSRALSLSQALQAATAMVNAGCRNVMDIESTMTKVLLDARVDAIDYARIVHGDTLEPLPEVTSNAVAIIAARLGTTRLIDNCILL